MERVFVAKVDDYDRHRIREVVSRGLDELEIDLTAGRWVAKPNWVYVHPRIARDSFTRPEVLNGALDELFGRWPRSRLTLVGNSGAGVPTRPMAYRAGVESVLRSHRGRVRLEPTDEGRLLRYRLGAGRPLSPEERRDPHAEPADEVRFWESITTSAALHGAEAVLYFPKLKNNVLAGGLTAALKLGGIGLLPDRFRMEGHNWHNDRRIADMLDVVVPDLVITDAIRAGWGGNQMTQPGVPLGVVIMATNPVAHDAVCARILGREPREIEYLRLAEARGFGPLDPSGIEVRGDVGVEKLRERMVGFGEGGLIPVERFGDRFREREDRELPLEIVSGPPYEWAGNQGVLLDWLYFSFDDPASRARMARWPPASVFVGGVERLPRHRLVYLVGDFAIRGFRKGAAVGPPLLWLPEWLRRPLGGFRAVRRWKARARGTGPVRGWVIEIPGDPPTHKDLIAAFFFGSLGRMRAPLFDVHGLLDAYARCVPQLARSWWSNRGGIEEVPATGGGRDR